MEKDAETYLREWAIIDGDGNMDGSFVPLSIAMIACKKVLEGKMELKPPTWIKPTPKVEKDEI